MSARARILVLGAHGCLGRVITAAIAASPDAVAIAGLHHPPGAGGPVRQAGSVPVQTRVVDATDAASLATALEGVTHVVNAVGGPPARLRAVATALCTAAAGRGGLRLVHISSMAVYGGATGSVAEDTLQLPQSRYGAAKIACEAEMRQRAGAANQLVILRPGIVYGPGSAQWTTRIARLLRQRRLGDLGGLGEGWCNLIHEQDLARAVLAACLIPEADGMAFNIATPAPPCWNAYLAAMARAIGADPVAQIGRGRMLLETRVLAPALQLGGRLACYARMAPWPDPIPPSLLRLFGQRIRLSHARADRVLRFVRTPDDLGIEALRAA